MEDVVITIQMEETMKKKIEKIASEQQRSLSGQIRFMIDWFLENN